MKGKSLGNSLVSHSPLLGTCAIAHYICATHGPHLDGVIAGMVQVGIGRYAQSLIFALRMRKPAGGK